MIGQTISHYKILEKLGEGGMGVVYKAHDINLDRRVALKFLPHHLTSTPEDQARFIQEAKAAATLNHPNICTIYGIEEESGQTFIAMEFVDGKTLKDVQTTLTFKQCLDVAVQIAKGLAAAHEHGIIHRDIKPENIMVRKDGIVVIMDFGLARLRGSSHLTETGTTTGTAGYMAPEQVLGQECDHRADIFSLGIVLYELFSGQSPFKGIHTPALMYEIVNVETQPISHIKPEINSELDSLILECLAKDPNERIQSAAEVRRQIGIITGNSKSLTKISKQSGGLQIVEPYTGQISQSFFIVWKKWLALSVIILLSGLLAVISIIHFNEPEELDLSEIKYTPIATDAEPEGQAEWSPDGKSIAYTRQVEGVYQVFVRNLDSPLPSKLTSLTKNAGKPFWSPDGNLVYFISKSSLYTIGLAGGEARKILDSIAAATISPDGKTIAFWRVSVFNSNYSSTVYLGSINDKMARRYNPAPFEIDGLYIPNFIHFSPDGKKIGLSTYRSGAEGAQIWILPWPDGGDIKPFEVFEQAKIQYPPAFSWMPDSRHIVLSSGKVLWIGDVESGKIRQVFKPIEKRISEPNVSSDGKRIVSTIQGEDYNIMQFPLDGSQPRYFLASSRNEMSMSFSSQGTKSLYITDRSGEDEVWLRMNDVDIRPIITKKDFPNCKGYMIMAAAISPDGNRAVCQIHTTDFGGRTFIISIEGGKPTRVLYGGNLENSCSWSSDSKYLAIYVLEKGIVRLAVVHVGSQEPPTYIPAMDSARGWINWSPDNKWIAFGSGHHIEMVSPDGKIRKKIPSPETASPYGYLLVWSRDGGTIYVASSLGRGARVHAVDVRSGRSRKIAEYGDDIEFSMPITYTLFGCLSPDGKSIITTCLDFKSDVWILDGLPQR